MKLQLTPKQVLQYIILGIDNENYQAVKDLAQDAIEQLSDDCEHDWTDATNHVIKSGEICLKCMSIRE